MCYTTVWHAKTSLMVLDVCVTVHHYFNNINNQQDATTFSFINLFNSALHVSGDKFAHPQEHLLTLYTAFGTMHRHCCRPVPRLRLNWECIVPKAVYTVKKCSWEWANLSPETCRADLKWLIYEKGFASCWLFTKCKLISRNGGKTNL